MKSLLLGCFGNITVVLNKAFLAVQLMFDLEKDLEDTAC